MLTLLLLVAASQGRMDRAPVLGAEAPPVVARILDSKDSFDLTTNRGQRPTILIFGSCT